MRHFGRFAQFTLAVLGLAWAAQAWSQGFPNRAMRMITSVAAGAPADVLCRIYADELSQRVGQAVVVENKPGGDNLISVDAVLSNPADGYSLLCINGGNMAPALHKSMPWDFLKVMTPVVHIYKFGFFLVVNGKLPVNNAQEFIAYAKANPGKLNYFYLVPTQQIGFALFAQRAGIDVVGIGYKGPEAYRDIISGTVHAGMDGPVSFRAQPEGTVKFLFTANDQRSPLTPNVPTAREAGLGDLQLPSGLTIWTKAGSPPEAINRVNAAMNDALKNSPRLIESIRATGGVVTGGPPEALLRQTELEFKIWADGAKLAHYEPQ
jgi:tripartite-type tricarboxylate transporter receptor subunit TctC